MRVCFSPLIFCCPRSLWCCSSLRRQAWRGVNRPNSVLFPCIFVASRLIMYICCHSNPLPRRRPLLILKTADYEKDYCLFAFAPGFGRMCRRPFDCRQQHGEAARPREVHGPLVRDSALRPQVRARHEPRHGHLQLARRRPNKGG